MGINPKRKKVSLVLLEISTLLLLWADRNAYIYRGNTTQLGYYMVRITNFMVFTMFYFILVSFNGYVVSIIKQLDDTKKTPRVLQIVRPIALLGIFLVILSQFTGFYYTFDENNLYHRSSGFIICYIIPLIILLLQLSVIIRIRKKIRKWLYCSLIFFVTVPLLASVLQIFSYGVSLTNISIGFCGVLLFVLAIVDLNQVLHEANQKEIDTLKKINNVTKSQFRQTALALATAIDAKDKYTHGHSRRVAEYSKQIAQLTGKGEEFCEELYFAALLHDVGKIGIPDSILTKEGRLTEEEFNIIKQHPSLGNQILSEINSVPYLSVGAFYHHERYDGHGYPNGKKGTDIPEIARIITVADAYDAMTSTRSYRTTLAQQKVREELVKGVGTQFDPVFAIAMIHILDKDTEYALKDGPKCSGFLEEYVFENSKEKCTSGIGISDHITRISFSYEPIDPQEACEPSVVVYDSLDEQVYTDEANKRKMEYTDFCDITFQGNVVPGQIRNYGIQESPNSGMEKVSKGEAIIETLKQRDHIFIRFIFADTIRDFTVALVDRSQFSFVAVTGKNCKVKNLNVKKFKEPEERGYIKRIAEEICYTDNRAEGDIKNLEIAGWREKHSEGVLIEGKLDFSFYAMSLPASRRLWHCPSVVIFSSDNGKVYGPNYKEFALIRFDGECWDDYTPSLNSTSISYNEKFQDWENWKKSNREGVHCTVSIAREPESIIVDAQDSGINIHNTTKIPGTVKKLYCAFTGDQVAITSIHVNRK